MTTSRSEALFAYAQQYIPGGLAHACVREPNKGLGAASNIRSVA